MMHILSKPAERGIKRKMEKKNKGIGQFGKVVGILAALVAIVVGAFAVAGSFSHTPVEAYTVKAVDVEPTIETVGTVESRSSKTYYSPIEAPLGPQIKEVGDGVNAGELLVSFDTEGLEEASIAADKAVEEAAAAQQAQAASTVATTSAEDAAAVAQSRENITYYQEQLADWTEYMEQSRGDYNARVDELKATEQPQEGDTILEEIAANIEDAKTQIETLSAWIAEEQANIEAINNKKPTDQQNQQEAARQSESTNLAELKAMDAKELLERAKEGILSDFDGVVIEVNDLKPGSTVAQGSELLTVASLKDVDLKVTIPIEQIEQVEVGQPAKISMSTGNYEGKVSELDKMTSVQDIGGETITALVRITNPDKNIVIGMNGDVSIELPKKSNVIAVPRKAIRASQDGDYVYVIENERVARRFVSTGVGSADMVEITEGLEAEEMIIVELPDGMREGKRVKGVDPNNQ